MSPRRYKQKIKSILVLTSVLALVQVETMALGKDAEGNECADPGLDETTMCGAKGNGEGLSELFIELWRRFFEQLTEIRERDEEGPGLDRPSDHDPALLDYDCGPPDQFWWVPGDDCHPDSTCAVDVDNLANARRMRLNSLQCIADGGTWTLVARNGVPNKAVCNIGGQVVTLHLPTNAACVAWVFTPPKAAPGPTPEEPAPASTPADDIELYNWRLQGH